MMVGIGMADGQTNSMTQGITWGGCVESIDEILRNGVAIPSLTDFENIVLIAETSEEIPSPDYVFRVFRALGERGVSGTDKSRARRPAEGVGVQQADRARRTPRIPRSHARKSFECGAGVQQDDPCHPELQHRPHRSADRDAVRAHSRN